MADLRRAEIRALAKAWASQDPKPGYNRVAILLSVEDMCDAGSETRAMVELPHATVLWLLRELDRFTK